MKIMTAIYSALVFAWPGAVALAGAKSKFLGAKNFSETMTCASTAAQQGQGFPQFLKCAKNNFSANLKSDEIRRMTQFLLMAREITPLRECEKEEVATFLSEASKSFRACFNFREPDGGPKHLGMAEWNKDSRLSSLRAY